MTTTSWAVHGARPCSKSGTPILHLSVWCRMCSGKEWGAVTTPRPERPENICAQCGKLHCFLVFKMQSTGEAQVDHVSPGCPKKATLTPPLAARTSGPRVGEVGGRSKLDNHLAEVRSKPLRPAYIGKRHIPFWAGGGGGGCWPAVAKLCRSGPRSERTLSSVWTL